MTRGALLLLTTVIVIVGLLVIAAILIALLPPLPELTGANTAPGFTCPVGQCVLDLETGVKSCPTDDQPLAFDPFTQGCTPPYACTWRTWTNAVGLYGATNRYGQCETGVQCDCLQNYQCQAYLNSIFTTGAQPRSVDTADPSLPGSSTRDLRDPTIIDPEVYQCGLPVVDLGRLPSIDCEIRTMSDVYDCLDRYKNSVVSICDNGIPTFISDTLPNRSADAIGYRIYCMSADNNCRDGSYQKMIPDDINRIGCATPAP